ncbi:DUF5654 family protein [Novosphingobium aquiterrae]|uniref:DUF5654 family protein n=1 Tax=Novosphingobium aquiterrae TaxID=624388 RepID=A0ABV6PGA7_9SPHN
MVAALAWNESIKATLAKLGLSDDLTGLNTYAILATVIAFVVLALFGRLAARFGGDAAFERENQRLWYRDLAGLAPDDQGVRLTLQRGESMQDHVRRRSVVKAGLSLAAVAAAAPLRAAQGPDDLGTLLGGKLPDPLRAAFPAGLGQVAQIVAQVLRLEQQAKALRLPASPLSTGEGGLPADPGRFYEATMPRLVALIDRAGTIDPQLGDEAGALLARLHRTQYDAPDAWFSQVDAAAAQVKPDGGGLLNLPSLPVRPMRLAEPPESEPLALPRPQLPEPAGSRRAPTALATAQRLGGQRQRCTAADGLCRSGRLVAAAAALPARNLQRFWLLPRGPGQPLSVEFLDTVRARQVCRRRPVRCQCPLAAMRRGGHAEGPGRCKRTANFLIKFL